MIGDPATLTTSGQSSHHFGPSYCTNNDKSNLQTVVVALQIRQKNICELFGRIGNKSDAYIIRGTKFLPPIIIRGIIKLNSLHGDVPNYPPREWNSQPPSYQSKYRTSPPKTIPVVSAITGRLNSHIIDIGDVEVHPSEFLVESNYESVTDPDTNTIKSIDDDEMEQNES